MRVSLSLGEVSDLSRRDEMTQPGVLTPGSHPDHDCPHKALRSRPRPRIRPRGVMECWSIGVLEYCAKSELHPPFAGLVLLKGHQANQSHRYLPSHITRCFYQV